MGFCKYCGSEISEGSEFCGNCGKKIEAAPANQEIIENTVAENTAAQEPADEAAVTAAQKPTEAQPVRIPAAAEETKAPSGSNPQAGFQPASGSPYTNYNPSFVNPNVKPQVLDADDLPAKFRPISPWAYWGYSLLYAIPIVGFIVLIINTFALKNVNAKNFARSYWIPWLFICILIILVLILSIAGVSLLGNLDFLSGIGLGSLINS